MNESRARRLPTREERAARDTRAEHDALLTAMQVLEAALASPAPGRARKWNARVLAELRGVESAIAAHVDSAEAPGGALAQILAVGGFTRRVRATAQEHATLAARAAALRRALERRPVPDEKAWRAVRRHAAFLTSAIRAHQAREAELLLDSLTQDIGVGD